MEFDATFIIAAISFLLFTFIMNKIFYVPVMKMIEDRELYVAANYKDAQEIKTKIEENINLKNSQLEETRDEGRGIISEKSNEFKRKNSEIIHSAKQTSVQNIEKMKEELVSEAMKSQEILMANAVDISKEISHTILGQEFSTESITADKIRRANN